MYFQFLSIIAPEAKSLRGFVTGWDGCNQRRLVLQLDAKTSQKAQCKTKTLELYGGTI